MNIIIIGAGNIGYYLAYSLISAANHDIKIVEKVHARSIIAANKLNIPIIHGDGSNISTLEKADAAHADILVALTGKDEDNFICCQLAKHRFHIKTTIAKVNNPKNVDIIKSLAADIVVSSVNMLSQIIEQQVNAIDYHFITRMTMGDTSIVEFVVSENGKICNRRISEIKWPKDTLVIAISRNQKSIVPNGESVLRSGDDVVISTKDYNKKYLKKLFS